MPALPGKKAMLVISCFPVGGVTGPLSGGTSRQVQCFFYGRGAGQPEEPFDEIMEVLSLVGGVPGVVTP
ncbi:MAG: hypothetical protein V8Q84_08505 [Bilophila sp.]